jgi:competence protein ComEC
VGLAARLITSLQEQRGHRFPWVPVFLGAGIALYFALPVEPPAQALWALSGAALLLILFAVRQREGIGPLAGALALVALGPVLAAWRTADVTAPVLPWRIYAPIEGRIVAIDRSQSDKIRLTLDQVYIRRLLPSEQPEYVRISLHGDAEVFAPEPGMMIRVTANLAPPDGPVEPGGFDFRRQAWFDSLGGVGYTRKPVEVLAEADGDMWLWLFRLRMKMSRAIQDGLPGPEGAFAAAMMTGDRSGMDEATTEALRVSNLAHLISISGLHMVLLTGTVFAVFRFGLALIAPLRRRVDLKKVAASIAALAGFFYLALSGWEVPTERAFIMVAVALGAVLLGRRAISLRGLAIAALIVLLNRPESVTEPGFQMSFAATLLLVVTFQWLDRQRLSRVPAFARPAVVLLLSSMVAGLATAPFAAVHFNRMSEYGLIANLLTSPAISILFMPAALLWVVLAPLGLGWIALWIIKVSLWWVLGVAHYVASLPSPVTLVVSPPVLVLPLIALAMLWPSLWQGGWRARALGLAPAALAWWLWSGAVRPPVLVASEGALVGVLGPEGRALSKKKGQGFAAETWLENDGDGATQEEAALRTESEGFPRYVLNGVEIAVLPGKKGLAALEQTCATADLVILSEPRPKGFEGPCKVLGKWQLRDSGGLAMWPVETGLRIEPVNGHSFRPWDRG